MTKVAVIDIAKIHISYRSIEHEKEVINKLNENNL